MRTQANCQEIRRDQPRKVYGNENATKFSVKIETEFVTHYLKARLVCI